MQERLENVFFMLCHSWVPLYCSNKVLLECLRKIHGLKKVKQKNRILLLILKVFWSRIISYVNIKAHRNFHFRFKFLTIDYGHIFQELVTFNRIFLQYSTKWIMYHFA